MKNLAQNAYSFSPVLLSPPKGPRSPESWLVTSFSHQSPDHHRKSTLLSLVLSAVLPGSRCSEKIPNPTQSLAARAVTPLRERRHPRQRRCAAGDWARSAACLRAPRGIRGTARAGSAAGSWPASQLGLCACCLRLCRAER